MAYTTIKKPSDYFNTITWSGNGTSGRNITGVGFQPDFVWYKNRTNAITHGLQDIIRGVTSTNVLSSDSNPGEPSFTNIGYLSSFDSDGFTATETNSNLNVINASGSNYVAWNWLADNTSGSSNTDGSITSTVSANTTSGFSIVSYTGTGANATVGHGLGAVPKMIIIKELNNATNWIVYHAGVGNGGSLQLNTTIATDTDSTFWNSTTSTSSVFSLGSNGNSNGSSDNYIAYCFAEKKGFSKFGSYTGNGSTDGVFVYLGFKPAFVMIKNTATATDWEMIDNKRAGYNDFNYRLFPNTSGTENTGDKIADILSNGFKIRNTSTAFNGSGNTMIYMAFAEEPLVGDNPATAR